MRHRSSHARRRGTILVCTLACVLVATLIGGVSVRLALQTRREAKLRHQLRQTEWLLEAGVRRAELQVAQNGENYPGERWEVPLDEFPGRTAVVTISLSKPTLSSSSRPVEVVASIVFAGDAATEQETRRSYRFAVPIDAAVQQD